MATHPTQGVFLTGQGGVGMGMAAVTPSDTENLVTSGYARSLYITGAGNLRAVGLDGVEFTVAVPANFVLPVAVTKVFSTNTTATNIFAIW